MRSPGCAGRRVTTELRQQHVVRARVALGEEPLAAAGAVEPPLALHAGDVVAEVVVGAQLARRGRRARARVDLAPEAEVGDLARAAVGTGQDVGHGTVSTTRHRRQICPRDQMTDNPRTSTPGACSCRCEDRPGIVAAVSRFLLGHGANIVAVRPVLDRPRGRHVLPADGLPPARPSTRAGRARARAFDDEVARRFEMAWSLHDAARPKRVAMMVSRDDHCLLDLLWRWRRGELDLDIGAGRSPTTPTSPTTSPRSACPSSTCR